MARRVVYVLALVPVVVIGLGLTFAIVDAQTRWDAAASTQADLRDARAALTVAEAARRTAEAAWQEAVAEREQIEADHARVMASIGELFQIACRQSP